eukprot:3102269-Amphidinium_carterae.1
MHWVKMVTISSESIEPHLKAIPGPFWTGCLGVWGPSEPPLLVDLTLILSMSRNQNASTTREMPFPAMSVSLHLLVCGSLRR